MKNWKKFASLLLVLVMCLSLAACGGEAEEDMPNLHLFCLQDGFHII